MVATSYKYEDGLAEVIEVMVSKVMEYVALRLLGFVHASFQYTRERSTAWNRLWDKLLSEPECYVNNAKSIKHGLSSVNHGE